MSAALRLVECRQILGGERDKLRPVWDEQASIKDRRLLLAMAGIGATAAARDVGRSWCDLSAERRAAVVGGLRRWSAWAERLQ